MTARARRPPLTAPAWAGWAAWATVAGTLALLTAAAAAWPARAALAGLSAALAAGWAWRAGSAAPRLRPWVAAVPLAAWAVGVGGWSGATVVTLAVLVALHRRGPLPASRARQERPSARPGDAGEPDQTLTRTGDVLAGELRIRCDGGGGTGHVLFWPAFPTAPRITCEPADGLGRVRAAQALPHGVRFEVTRPEWAGDGRVCFEARAE